MKTFTFIGLNLKPRWGTLYEGVDVQLRDETLFIVTNQDPTPTAYVLDSEWDGSIIVTGDSHAHAIRKGSGNGNAIRDGNSNSNAISVGDAIRSGQGKGNAIRRGKGLGNAFKRGLGKGNAFVTVDANGKAFKEHFDEYLKD